MRFCAHKPIHIFHLAESSLFCYHFSTSVTWAYYEAFLLTFYAFFYKNLISVSWNNFRIPNFKSHFILCPKSWKNDEDSFLKSKIHNFYIKKNLNNAL